MKCNVLKLSAAVVCGYFFAASAMPASADSKEPKTACGEITDLIADGRTDELRPYTANSPEVTDEVFAVIKSQLDTAKSFGMVRLKSFLVDKSYEDVLSKVWYVIVFGKQPIYVRCTFLKLDGEWKLSGFSFQSKTKDIDLP